jgi:hypothetical protein
MSEKCTCHFCMQHACGHICARNRPGPLSVWLHRSGRETSRLAVSIYRHPVGRILFSEGEHRRPPRSPTNIPFCDPRKLLLCGLCGALKRMGRPVVLTRLRRPTCKHHRIGEPSCFPICAMVFLGQIAWLVAEVPPYCLQLHAPVPSAPSCMCAVP